MKEWFRFALVPSILVLAMTAALPARAEVFDGADWLRDPAFEGASVIDFYAKQDADPPELSGPQHVHTLFRQIIDVDAEPSHARLYVTGDDHFVFYINGAHVTQGPAPSYPFAHRFLSVDVTEHIRAGENALASHVYYQGLRNRRWYSGDNRSGFIMALDVTYANGDTDRYVTDETWRRHTSDAFPRNRVIGFDAQFAEDIDMRRWPAGWTNTGFDDSEWGRPLVERQDHIFVPQHTPPIQIWRAEPRQMRRVEEGGYLYDFGHVLAGHTRIRVRGPEGHRIEVRHGEELGADGRVRYAMRADCTYREFPVLSGGEDTIPFHEYRSFRYLEVLDAPEEPEVWVMVRHYPFANDAAFAASEPLLEAIWRLSANSVRFGAQEGFVESPSREKGQYIGDAYIASRPHMLLTGDYRLVRQAIESFQQSQRACDGLMAAAPASYMQEIVEYSLQWPLILEQYYQFSGDLGFVQRMVDDGFDGLFGYFAAHENEHGLLSGFNDKWIMIDWPPNLRGSFDYDYAEQRDNAVVNAFYYRALRSAAALTTALGRDASAYSDRAEQVKAAYRDRLYDTDRRLFTDASGADSASLHTNALALGSGLAPDEAVPAIIDLIRDEGLNCGVYFAGFVIEACFKAGEPELAYELLTNTSERSWAEMLRHGATASMEVWGPDQKWNTSWLHTWGGSPVYLMTQHLMGLTPGEPGWERIRFAPQMSSEVERAEIRIPIPAGHIMAQYRRGRGFRITAPEGAPVDIDAGDTPVEVVASADYNHDLLTRQQQQILDEHDWDEWVSGEMGVWVCVDEQRLRLVREGRILWEAPCATAKRGTGNQAGSYMTPLGWHSVAEKFGDDAPWGQVFRARARVNEVWRFGQDVESDMVLTRILWLTGEEPGKNQGGDVDSYRRYIYIHGTNGENLIGVPSSMGCVRMRNDDVITAYNRIPTGAKVLITETE